MGERAASGGSRCARRSALRGRALESIAEGRAIDSATQQAIRSQLEDRRQRLGRAITEVGRAGDLVRLLREVDSALERVNGHEFGRCEVCHEHVETDFLRSNPLVRYCLCELSPAQQARLQSDLELASRLQWALLPKQGLCWGDFETHFRYEPAGAVSGDYCDLVADEEAGADGALHFLVGDVSGKGVAASFVMAHLNALFRSLIATGLAVGQVVERANRLLLDKGIASHYATLVCGRARRDGRVELCNAGHGLPLHLRGGEVRAVEGSGMPIGLFGGRSYTVSEVALESGDSLVLYTDGLIEAEDPAGADYGLARLRSLLVRRAAERPGPLAAAVLEDLARHRADGPRADDVTLLVLRYA